MMVGQQKLLIVVFIIAMTFSHGHAQESAAYDLQGVITRALAANPNIHAARQAVTTAQTKVEEARAHKLPTVQGEAGYLRLDKDPSFTVAPMGTLVFGVKDNPWENISLDWPIYTGGLISGMIAASRQGVDAAWQDYARTRQETAAEAATAYYQVLSAQRMVEVMQGQVTTLKEAVRVSTGLHDQGVVAKLDVLRPTADLATAQTALAQAENGYQLALANLKRVLNLPQETAITLTQTTETPAASSPELPAAIQAALGHRPEMKQLQAYLRATDAQREIVLAGRKPQLGVHAQYDFERPTTYPEIGTWSVAVVLRQPLFDGGTTRAQLHAVRSQREELHDREEALRQGITMQVTNAVLTMQTAEKKVQSATQAEAAAEEAYRAAEASYKNQIVPMLDVLSAQSALTNARVQRALAEFDRQTALVQYHLALGDTPESENERSIP